MIARPSVHRSPLVAVLLLAACSPDLSLLSDQASFAGASAGGESASSAGTAGSASNAGSVGNADGGTAGALGGDSSSAGDNATTGGANDGGEPAGGGGASNDAQPPNGGAGGEQSRAPGITTTFEKDLPLLGDSAGGALFSDDCKDGEALAGVGVTIGAFLSQIHGICRTLSLVPSGNAAHGYAVKLTGDRALPAHPSSSQDTAINLACAEDEAVIGLRLAQQHYDLGADGSVPVIVRVWLTCAKLVLVEVDAKLGITWQGAKELAPASGSIANGTAWLVSSVAPAGLVASRLLGASGSWVDRVGFGVSRLDVVTR